MADKKESAVVLRFTEEEKARCKAYAKKLIDLLAPLSWKEKWLVIKTAEETFPKKNLLLGERKKGLEMRE